jgi:hypothetical protein
MLKLKKPHWNSNKPQREADDAPARWSPVASEKLVCPFGSPPDSVSGTDALSEGVARVLKGNGVIVAGAIQWNEPVADRRL